MPPGKQQITHYPIDRKIACSFNGRNYFRVVINKIRTLSTHKNAAADIRNVRKKKKNSSRSNYPKNSPPSIVDLGYSSNSFIATLSLHATL